MRTIYILKATNVTNDRLGMIICHGVVCHVVTSPYTRRHFFNFAYHHELFVIKTIAELKEARQMPSYIASSDT